MYAFFVVFHTFSPMYACFSVLAGFIPLSLRNGGIWYRLPPCLQVGESAPSAPGSAAYECWPRTATFVFFCCSLVDFRPIGQTCTYFWDYVYIFRICWNGDCCFSQSFWLDLYFSIYFCVYNGCNWQQFQRRQVFFFVFDELPSTWSKHVLPAFTQVCMPIRSDEEYTAVQGTSGSRTLAEHQMVTMVYNPDICRVRGLHVSAWT